MPPLLDDSHYPGEPDGFDWGCLLIVAAILLALLA